MDKKKGLGRGLESLFALYDDEIQEPKKTNVKKETIEETVNA